MSVYIYIYTYICMWCISTLWDDFVAPPFFHLHVEQKTMVRVPFATTQLWHVPHVHIPIDDNLEAALVSGSKTAGGCQSAVHWHECIAGHGGSDQSLRDSRCSCVAGQSYASWIFLANEKDTKQMFYFYFFLSSSLIKIIIIIAALCFTYRQLLLHLQGIHERFLFIQQFWQTSRDNEPM